MQLFRDQDIISTFDDLNDNYELPDSIISKNQDSVVYLTYALMKIPNSLKLYFQLRSIKNYMFNYIETATWSLFHCDLLKDKMLN